MNLKLQKFTYSSSAGIGIYLAKNELPHAREKLMAHFLFAN